jgi:protein-S-isoprenylcysteine O-methyltransferase Ste14
MYLTRALFALLLLAFALGLAIKVSRQRRVLGRSPIVLGAAGEGGLVDWWDRVAPAALILWPASWIWVAVGGAPLADGVRGALGLVLIVLGAAFALASIFLMGRAWRIGIDPENRSELAEEGPYRWIRHPIYSGMLLVALGNALVVPHPAITAIAVVTGLGFAFQARREERHLLRTFGDRYARYTARTGRFAPRLRSHG